MHREPSMQPLVLNSCIESELGLLPEPPNCPRKEVNSTASSQADQSGKDLRVERSMHSTKILYLS